ncbi:hypothetical protein ACFIOY_40050 [Bradyrhizobium sp. TZ2]
MEYAATALAILGFAVGIAFRFKVLLPIIGVLLLASVVFSLASGFSFLDTALTVLTGQAILQGSYFLGLLIRAIIRAITLWLQRMRSLL